MDKNEFKCKRCNKTILGASIVSSGNIYHIYCNELEEKEKIAKQVEKLSKIKGVTKKIQDIVISKPSLVDDMLNEKTFYYAKEDGDYADTIATNSKIDFLDFIESKISAFISGSKKSMETCFIVKDREVVPFDIQAHLLLKHKIEE